LSTLFREVLASNPDLVTSYSKFSRDFPGSVQANAATYTASF